MLAENYLPVKVDDLHLSPKDIKFVGSYTSNGYDGPKAILEAGILPEDASRIKLRAKTHEYLAREEINTAINRVTEETLAPYRNRLLTQMVARLNVRANWQLSWFYYDDHTAKPLSEIPADYQWAIDDVEIKHFGKNGDIIETKYKLADQDLARKELKAMLDRKEGVKEETGDMRARLSDIFHAAREVIEISKEVARLEEPVPAQEQETIIEPVVVAPPKPDPLHIMKIMKNA